MSEIDLSIVIVNWNSVKYVASCIRSIISQTSDMRFEVIVVDNASFDGSGELLAREFPWVRFVQSNDNVGFGAANNLGVSHARGTVLLFLNPDTEVLAGAIDCLYRHLGRMDDLGVLGGRLLNTDRSLQTSCVQALPTVWNQIFDADLLRRCFPRAELWGTAALYAPALAPSEVEAVSGACMMLRRGVFEAVDGFSPAFFMYGEDLDLCDRVRRAGFRNHYAGDAEIVHHGSGSSRRTFSQFSVVMMRESVALFLSRCHGPFRSSGYRVASGVVACIRLGILAVVFPAWLIRLDGRSWTAACRKWFAILRWALGLHPRFHSRQRTAAISARA